MINGYSDHCHCLISLGSHQNIGKIVQLIKENLHIGLNPKSIDKEKFVWQIFCSFVSESMIDLRDYIKHQENIIKRKRFKSRVSRIYRKI